jgi:hypothetical protein
VSITCNIKACFGETYVWNCLLIKSFYFALPGKSLMVHKHRIQLFRDDTFPLCSQLQVLLCVTDCGKYICHIQYLYNCKTTKFQPPLILT